VSSFLGVDISQIENDASQIVAIKNNEPDFEQYDKIEIKNQEDMLNIDHKSFESPKEA
jgi:hypothetical protein